MWTQTQLLWPWPSRQQPIFAHDILTYNDVLQYWVWFGLVTKGWAIQKISSKVTLIKMFNLGYDLDHSNPIFSLDTFLLMVIYHQIEFGCKRLIRLELIKDIVETLILWLCKSSLQPWP